MTETDSDQRPHFVYLVEGEPYVGHVGDYAKAYEHSHYDGLDVPFTVWTFVNGKPESHPIIAEHHDWGRGDDYAYTTLSVLGDSATARIDLRA